MKIIDIEVRKETVEETGNACLRCLVTMADGNKIESVVPWRNPLGMWASPNDEREHAEVSAWLRAFAKAIEDAGRERDAA